MAASLGERENRTEQCWKNHLFHASFQNGREDYWETLTDLERPWHLIPVPQSGPLRRVRAAITPTGN